MNNYICKIASYEELKKRWDYLIDIHDNSEKWIKFKNKALKDYISKNTIVYFGILDNNIICEITAYVKEEAFLNDIEDYQGLLTDDMIYLAAFRTNKEFENKGYFSKLFKYVVSDLKNKGFKFLSVGVENSEERNKSIYYHLGFTDFIKTICDDEEINFYKKEI